ncbi:ADORA2A [Mytilus coruscus]|uniref:ADORA2A n=1 Tax=Mytilus coruscus TaxID=42192 RepID=A0A6J8DC79_MYTCO|nr:ADORA2A [Mytilus coruscus]
MGKRSRMVVERNSRKDRGENRNSGDKDTDTTLEASKVNTVTIVFTTLAALTVVVDISYIVVSFKALKKTFYNLTILALFFSDITLGITSALFSLAPLIKYKTVGPCLLQIFIASFGVQSNYCLIFLLCLQRYLVVKSFNFGTSDKFDKNKFLFIGVAMFIVLTLSLSGSILPPRAEFIHICRPPIVYGDSLYIFVVVILLPVTIIIFLLLTLSMLTSFRLWKLHFKGKIAPLQVLSEGNKITDCMHSNILTTKQGSQKAPCDNRQGEDKVEVISIQNIKMHHVELNANDSSEKEKSSRIMCSEDHHVLNCLHCTTTKATEKQSQFDNTYSFDKRVTPNCMSKVQETLHRNSDAEKNGSIPKENRKIETTDLTRKTNTCTTSSDVENSAAPTCHTQMIKTWEIRAVLTTIIIAFQTIALTGPFVASYWIEIFSNVELTLQTRLLLLVPFLINSFSNPFIYAWRIPEIRHEFRRLFRMNAL